MLNLLLLICLLLPFAAQAATPEPDAAVSALTNMEGRYTIGPWEGTGQGKACTLTNNEPLARASLEISLLHDQLIARVTPALPEAQPIVKEFPLDAASQPFFSIGQYTYDTRGLDRALVLLRQCLDGKLPANLPYEPIEESEPQEIAPQWQMITLRLGDYTYARYATYGDGQLGLWVHNGNQYVLGLSGMEEGKLTTITLNGQELPAVPQQDGALVPLTRAQLEALASAGKIAVKFGNYAKTFDIKDLQRVTAALQLSR